MTRTRATLCLLLLAAACGPTAVSDEDAGGPGGGDPDAGAPPPSDLDCSDDGDLEGCACAPAGATRACWPDEAPGGVRGVGACHDGSQVCVATDDTSPAWGPCMAAQLPTDDVSTDGQDQDCDGDDGDQTCTVESCTDGVDNDCDGAADCGDIDCDPNPVCNPCPGSSEDCSNDVDDDCDGLADCADPTCIFTIACIGACFVPEDCTNGVDDNCDGRADCLDMTCASTPDCGCSCTPGTTRWCDTPAACTWGLQECMPDGTWGACNETTPPAPCSSGLYDTSCCLSYPDACCQDYADSDGDGDTYESVGECDGIVSCM